jgi:AcrR family transcriptional regulator
VTEKPTLRAEQVAQTRQALVDAGLARFGEAGFAATSVEEIARTARVTIGALYHHFPTKTALFEAVFEHIHDQVLVAAEEAAMASTDPVESLKRGIDHFLDAMLDPAYQRIAIIDAPAVLGLSRFTELDERNALATFVEVVRVAGLRTSEPELLSRLIFGMLTRAGMLIATAKQPKRERNRASRVLRELVDAFTVEPGTGTAPLNR